MLSIICNQIHFEKLPVISIRTVPNDLLHTTASFNKRRSGRTFPLCPLIYLANKSKPLNTTYNHREPDAGVEIFRVHFFDQYCDISIRDLIFAASERRVSCPDDFDDNLHLFDQTRELAGKKL
ncbi:hypothetical protein Zmor_026213 [Zophobas morio]|uniref:Uncharacterized protein n=1 Tax=Zophobas morio TaxID=2755281 RepID=A0AA38M4W6_9CUCU|nr:hypothetical protein Zmor_026213 [Zophobas morio]